MRNIFIAALASGGMLAAVAASAQTNDMYTTGTGSNMMVMGGTAGEQGAPVAASQDQCRDGGYYMSGDNMVTACGSNGRSYDLSQPGSGAMMTGNKPYPQGAMMMKERSM